jgi:hypothetical protein
MRVTSTTVIITVLFCLNQVLFGQIPSDWKQVVDKNNVEVFLHHCHEQNIRAFRAVTTISLPLDSLEAIFDNVQNYSKWQESVKESKVVHRTSDSRYHFYTRNHQGWPAKDLDLMCAVEKNRD